MSCPVMYAIYFTLIFLALGSFLLRYRPRFFDQVEYQTTFASIGNRHFFAISCYRQTYQNYAESGQKLGKHFGRSDDYLFFYNN